MTKIKLLTSFLLIFTTIFSFACGSNSSDGTSRTNTVALNTNSTNSGMNNSTVSNMNTANSNVAVVQDKFWTSAAQGGMAEVELGKLALQKSQNAEVKKFAQMMVTDHTKANDELKSVAAKKNVTLPTDMGGHKATFDNLSRLTGAEFDKAYVEAMVADHESTVDLFEDNSDNSDADVKGFAAKTLPTLKSHLEMIKGIQSKMK